MVLSMFSATSNYAVYPRMSLLATVALCKIVKYNYYNITSFSPSFTIFVSNVTSLTLIFYLIFTINVFVHCILLHGL